LTFAGASLINSEKIFRFLDAGRVAKELESDVALTFLQDDSQKTQLVSRKTPANIVLCLSNDVSLKQSRSKGRFEVNHNGRNKEQTGCRPKG
jgi:hypothetical protein